MPRNRPKLRSLILDCLADGMLWEAHDLSEYVDEHGYTYSGMMRVLSKLWEDGEIMIDRVRDTDVVYYHSVSHSNTRLNLFY